MIRTAFWVTCLVFAAIYIIYAVATVDRRDDESQIRSMIENATVAVQKRDLSRTIGCVSEKYNDGAMNYDRLRLVVAQALRTEANYTARSEIRSLDIDGEKATVEVFASVKPSGGGTLYERTITLSLTREPARHAFIVPTKAWRITSSSNLGLMDFEF